MNKRNIIWLIAAVLILSLAVRMTTGVLQTEQTFSNATLKYGSKGQDVRELQGRLTFIGFYKGKIDGDFGWQTQRAVKDFQHKFGMKVDGVVGPKTKERLVNATKAWKPGGTGTAAGGTGAGGGGGAAGGGAPGGGAPGGARTTATAGATRITPSSNRGFSAEDLKLMANAVYGEARGEPYEGQVAVAAVILNRIDSSLFPNTVSGVIFQPRAFTAVDDGQIWLTPNDSARKAVQDAINGWDPTGGCLYYFNPVTATSKWIWTRTQIKTIGKHIFCI